MNRNLGRSVFVRLLARALLLFAALWSVQSLGAGSCSLLSVRLPVEDETITVRYLLLDDQKRPVVIINHGERSGTSTAVEKSRRNYSLERSVLFKDVVGFWQRQGFHIVAPLRRGYGDSGSRYSGSFGSCDEPDFVTAGENIAKEISAAIDWIGQQDWFDGRIVITGSSGGGFASVYTATKNIPGVRGVISFSGFRGAVNPEQRRRHPCGEDLQTELYRDVGKSTEIPALWIFAENDPLIAPEVVRKWADAYREYGRAGMKLLMFPPLRTKDGRETSGHTIYRRVDLWGKEVEVFLDQVMGPSREGKTREPSGAQKP